MGRVLKWIGIVVGALVGLILLALVVVFAVSGARINKSYDIPTESVTIPTDVDAVAYGEHLAITRGCTDCHTANLSGGAFINDPAIGSIYAANLTPGQGGIGDYSDADLVRAIRHGVDAEGKPLLFMPAQEFYFLSDADLGAVIAYLRSLPPVDNVNTENSVGPLGRILFLAGQFPLLPVELIDHTGPRPETPKAGVTVEYGAYLAVGCAGCHGQDFAGGPIPGAPPDAPLAANLTPAGKLADWSEEDFVTALRTGVTPDGRELDPFMPWESTVRHMTDDELSALWLYMQSLPVVGSG